MKISFSAKCSDLFHGSIYDDEGNELIGLDGYVPNDINIGGGDYVELTIDLATGQIEGWEPVDADVVQSMIEEQEYKKSRQGRRY